ncbi:MAG: AMP-binding protein [Hyphomonadaceae bacterium]
MRIYDIARPDDRTIPAALDFQARESAVSVWLWTDARKVTFAQAAEATRRYAAGLHALGLKKGDTIVMDMNPSIDVVLVAVGAARLGVIFTTINTDYHGAFLREAIDQSKARILIIDHDLAPRLEGLDLAHIDHIYAAGAPGENGRIKPLEALLGDAKACPHVDVGWLDPVQVWWSSGTTGKSKGVMHSHSSIMLLARRGLDRKLKAGDVYYACTPMYLGSPWTGTIWPSLIGGVTGAIDPRFSVSQFWDRIKFYGAKHFFTLGAMHMHLWKQPPKPDDHLSGVRCGQAIPMSWDLIPEFKKRFGIETMNQAYGTSESFMVFEARDNEGHDWRGAAMGKPLPHLDVALLDEFDREVPMGEAGEICVRPKEPGVMFLGYFNDPALTVQTWRNLWHHTGDMAMRDEAGVYYFADRKKDYIRYNGRNISMFEVEAVVDNHPDLADVAAYGVTAEELESEAELTLAVVRKPGRAVTPEAIAVFINDNAPYYFVPRYIQFVEELPRNAHGRIMKHILRDRGLPSDAWDRKKAGFTPRR